MTTPQRTTPRIDVIVGSVPDDRRPQQIPDDPALRHALTGLLLELPRDVSTMDLIGAVDDIVTTIAAYGYANGLDLVEREQLQQAADRVGERRQLDGRIDALTEVESTLRAYRDTRRTSSTREIANQAVRFVTQKRESAVKFRRSMEAGS